MLSSIFGSVFGDSGGGDSFFGGSVLGVSGLGAGWGSGLVVVRVSLGVDGEVFVFCRVLLVTSLPLFLSFDRELELSLIVPVCGRAIPEEVPSPEGSVRIPLLTSIIGGRM